MNQIRLVPHEANCVHCKPYGSWPVSGLGERRANEIVVLLVLESSIEMIPCGGRSAAAF